MTESAGFGSIVHDFLMRVPRVGRELALEQVPDPHRAALEALNLDGLPLDASAYAQEVAIAYDTATDTARELCRGMGRPDYSLYGIKPTEVVGTLDVLGLTEDAVVVLDYKTGWADLGPVKDNWQLRGCALLAARLHHRQKAIVGIIRIKPAGEEHFSDRANLMAMDLDIVQDALVELRDRKARFIAQDKAGQAVPTLQGSWCTYCPSFDFCPSKQNLIAVGLGLTPHRASYFPAVLSPETAPIAYKNMELLRGVLKRYEETFNEYAAAHPVALGNGYVYGRKDLSAESIDVDKAKELLDRWMGEEAEAAIEVKRSLSKDAARAILTKRFKGKKDPLTGDKVNLSRMFDVFMESLREAGAIRVRVTHPVMKYRQKAESEDESEAA
jgi:hypothetical protein